MKEDLRRALLAILWGGAAAGTADIISATGNSAGRGGTPLSVLQYIGSGLLGAVAFQGGWLTGMAGLLVHFGLTTIMAALFSSSCHSCRSWLSWSYCASRSARSIIPKMQLSVRPPLLEFFVEQHSATILATLAVA